MVENGIKFGNARKLYIEIPVHLSLINRWVDFTVVIGKNDLKTFPVILNELIERLLNKTEGSQIKKLDFNGP